MKLREGADHGTARGLFGSDFLGFCRGNGPPNLSAECVRGALGWGEPEPFTERENIGSATHKYFPT